MIKECKHLNTMYQPEEDDTNAPESYSCEDCDAELDIPEQDPDTLHDEQFEEFGTWLDVEKS